MTDQNPVMVEITFPNSGEAEKTATELVDRKLVACANILQARSIYSWKGETESAGEWVLFAKTDLSKFKEIEAFVAKTHSYDVPCILALSIVVGAKSYMEWFYENLGQPVRADSSEPPLS